MGAVVTVADWTQPWLARAGIHDRNPNMLCWYAMGLCHIIHLLTSAMLHGARPDDKRGLFGSREVAYTVHGCAQP